MNATNPLGLSLTVIQVAAAGLTVRVAAVDAVEPPPGFIALFNRRDLIGLRGGDTFDYLDPRQADGSAYGMVAAARGYQRAIGEWKRVTGYDPPSTQSQLKADEDSTLVERADEPEFRLARLRAPRAARRLRPGARARPAAASAGARGERARRRHLANNLRAPR